MPVVAEQLAATAVMIPERGMVKEKFDVPPRFIVPPTKLMLEAAFPNPIKLAVLANPAIVAVKTTVVPEANGMMAPAPAGPVGPVGP